MKEDIINENNDENIIVQEKEAKGEKNNKQENSGIQDEEKKDKIKFNKKHKITEKDIKEMNLKNKNRFTYIILFVIIIIAILFFSTIFALININNQKIITGITIKGIEVSGLTKEEARAKLETIYNEKKSNDLKLKYEEYETSLNYEILEVNYDIEKAVNEAYLTGRNNNIFISNYEILKTLIFKKDVNVDMNLNEDIAKQSIDDISVNLPGVVVESSYAIEDDELIISKGKEGICVETEKLLDMVKEKINDINAKKDEYINIPVINKKPEEINIEKIHEEVYKEAKDAYYTRDPFTIYPEVIGVDFDIEEAKKILEEDKEEYVIKLTLTNPKVTIVEIGAEAFPEKLSTFSTRYDPGDKSRTTNLIIACEKLNGKVIMPGEEFSYNKTLGPRTIEAGYKNGKIYSNGQVVDGIGGGICQISSTLYNSVLTANLEIVERRNHQFVTSYVGPGRDATVVYGVTDFKFKNTRKYPIRLVASCKNGIATISIYGIKEENEYTFQFKTNQVSTIPYTTKYIEDNTLEEGKEVVIQKGVNGVKTETYITKLLNGKIVSTTLLLKDTYNDMNKIVKRGTKKSTTESNSVEAPTTNTTTSTEEQQKIEETENDNNNPENNIDENIIIE